MAAVRGPGGVGNSPPPSATHAQTSVWSGVMMTRCTLAIILAAVVATQARGEDFSSNLVTRGDRQYRILLDECGNLQLASFGDCETTNADATGLVHVTLGCGETPRAARLAPWMREGLFGVIQTEDKEGRFHYYGLAVESAGALDTNVAELLFETSTDYRFIEIENPEGDTVTVGYGTGEGAELILLNGCPIVPSVGILYDVRESERIEIYNEMDHFDFETLTPAAPPNLDLLMISEDELP